MTSTTIKGLTNGTPYTFILKSLDISGNASDVTTSNTVTLADLVPDLVSNKVIVLMSATLMRLAL